MTGYCSTCGETICECSDRDWGDKTLPFSVRQNTVQIFGVDVIVHHLNTGRRIIEADSMAALFEAMAGGECGPIDPDAFRELLA